MRTKVPFEDVIYFPLVTFNKKFVNTYIMFNLFVKVVKKAAQYSIFLVLRPRLLSVQEHGRYLTKNLTFKFLFYIDIVAGLQTYPVSSYKEIEYYLEECNKNRTVAVTNMNENSRSVSSSQCCCYNVVLPFWVIDLHTFCYQY